METYHGERKTSKGIECGKPPGRTHSQRMAILCFLRERGAAGVLGSELYAEPCRFGRSPRNRVSELRKAGFRIVGAARGTADWHYALIAEPQPIPASAKWKALRKKAIDIELPLFAGVAP